MLPIRHSINPILRRVKATAGDKHTLWIRISYGGYTPIDVPLKLSLQVKHWDKATKRMRAGTTTDDGMLAQLVNQYIYDTTTAIERVFTHFSLIEQYTPDRETLREAIYRELNRKGRASSDHNPMHASPLAHLILRMIASQQDKGAWSEATKGKFRLLSKHLNRYHPLPSIEHIDSKYVDGFIHHLTHTAGMLNSTASNMVILLKWFLRWAAGLGLYHGNVHTTYKVRLRGRESKDIIYLTQQEMELMRAYKGSKQMEQIRDVFIFSCFTGLRYSDVCKLTLADIKADHISVVTQKTSDSLMIDLNKHSREIIDRYSRGKAPQQHLFDAPTNYKANSMLKAIARSVGIDTPIREVYFRGAERIERVRPKYALISTHCGRRTFVVNALRVGIPPEVIMRWTGHSSYDAMKPYIAIVDELKRSQMSKLDAL